LEADVAALWIAVIGLFPRPHHRGLLLTDG
jgi:hypothetical protein